MFFELVLKIWTFVEIGDGRQKHSSEMKMAKSMWELRTKWEERGAGITWIIDSLRLNIGVYDKKRNDGRKRKFDWFIFGK